MKTEGEIRKYLEEVQQQIQKEIRLEHRQLVLVGKSIAATLMWVLGDTTLDLNRLNNISGGKNDI